MKVIFENIEGEWFANIEETFYSGSEELRFNGLFKLENNTWAYHPGVNSKSVWTKDYMNVRHSLYTKNDYVIEEIQEKWKNFLAELVLQEDCP